MKINDAQLYPLFAGVLDGKGRIEIVPAHSASESYSVHVELEVQDNHRGDSPDVVRRLQVTISHPNLPPLEVEVPIPIEGEKAGIAAAIENLKELADRGHFPQRLPMLAVGGSGNPAHRVVQVKMPTRVEIAQIP